jgi:AcrR family transcriptional regulator
MSSAAEAGRQAGRGPIPRGARRRAEIARAAEQVFLEHGFAETTMQRVVNAAGSSKETLYRHFGSKEELFIEVVNHRNSEVRRELDASLDSVGPMPVVLHAVGTALLQCLCSPAVAALARMIVNETHRHPSLGEAFYAMAPGRTLQKLTGYLTEARVRGDFTGDDPARAAEIFTGSVMGKFVPLMLFTPNSFAIEPAQIEGHVTEVVRVFTATYAA